MYKNNLFESLKQIVDEENFNEYLQMVIKEIKKEK
jgi:hypothetical protein